MRTPQLRKIEANYYWVAGTDIYLINHDISEGMASFAKVLTQEEISLLPIEIVYTGPHQDFNTDEEEAFRLVARVIELMNMMQDPEWHSYPLGTYNSLNYYCCHTWPQLTNSNECQLSFSSADQLWPLAT